MEEGGVNMMVGGEREGRKIGGKKRERALYYFPSAGSGDDKKEESELEQSR